MTWKKVDGKPIYRLYRDDNHTAPSVGQVFLTVSDSLLYKPSHWYWLSYLSVGRKSVISGFRICRTLGAAKLNCYVYCEKQLKEISKSGNV